MLRTYKLANGEYACEACLPDMSSKATAEVPPTERKLKWEECAGCMRSLPVIVLASEEDDHGRGL